MDRRQGKFLLIMGLIITVLSVYLLFIDLLIGVVGLLVGIWNIINGMLTMRGKSFFQSKDKQDKLK